MTNTSFLDVAESHDLRVRCAIADSNQGINLIVREEDRWPGSESRRVTVSIWSDDRWARVGTVSVMQEEFASEDDWLEAEANWTAFSDALLTKVSETGLAAAAAAYGLRASS
ncbi:MAG: hypothetical protein ACKOWF_02365 [Chloroflexota bacterium]